MNYDNPELQHRLAAEYVLGTLQGQARERFIRLMAEKPRLRELTKAWEQRLNPWGNAAMPQKVPAHVWANIRARLGFIEDTKPRWRDRLWQGWAIGGTLLAAVLAGVLVFRPPVASTGNPAASIPVSPTALAVLGGDKGDPVWLVQTDAHRARLWLTRLNGARTPANHDLELWSIPADGKPRSLGVMQQHGDTVEIALDPSRRDLISRATVLAISLEPLHGSPTGLPTGPVLYTGKPLRT